MMQIESTLKKKSNQATAPDNFLVSQ